MLQRFLYLRYASTSPDKESKPRPILPISVVSELLKIPLYTLQWWDRQYFAKK